MTIVRAKILIGVIDFHICMFEQSGTLVLLMRLQSLLEVKILSVAKTIYKCF